MAAAQSALAGSRALASQLGDEIAGLVAAAQTRQQCGRLRGGAGHHKRRNFHVDHYGREHRRRRSRYALLRCAVDHSASRKYYQSDDGPCGR